MCKLIFGFNFEPWLGAHKGFLARKKKYYQRPVQGFLK